MDGIYQFSGSISTGARSWRVLARSGRMTSETTHFGVRDGPPCWERNHGDDATICSSALP
jgi:hypothetical protein